MCSKCQPQTKLNVPRRAHSSRDPSGTRTTDRGIRQIEYRVIEQVEEFGAVLQFHPLADRKLFEDGEGQIVAARTPQYIAPAVAVCVLERSEPGRTAGVERRVEPARWIAALRK